MAQTGLYPWQTSGWKKAFGGSSKQSALTTDYTPYGLIKNNIVNPAYDYYSANRKKTSTQQGRSQAVNTFMTGSPTLPAASNAVHATITQQPAVVKPDLQQPTVTQPASTKKEKPRVVKPEKITSAFSNDNIYSREAGLPNLTPQEVSAMQSTLGVPVDGKFGANTYSALAQAQYAYGNPTANPSSSVSVADDYNYGGLTQSDVAGSTIPSGSQGSMFGNLFDNSTGYWSHNVNNMPAGLSPQGQAAYLQAPSDFSQLLGNVNSGVSAFSGLYDMYNVYQQNKMAKDAYNMQRSELARQVAKDQAFSSNINKSGLGTRA